jgi:hypothetical protein
LDIVDNHGLKGRKKQIIEDKIYSEEEK